MPVTRSYSYSADVMAAAIRGYESGRSQREIGGILKVPRTTLRQWIHEYRSGKLNVPVGSVEHPHHWILPAPGGGGGTVGTCKVCFEQKKFSNVFVENEAWMKRNAATKALRPITRS